MKNHCMVDGKLLQANKKFSHLKESQKEWILHALQERHMAAMQKTKKILTKKEREQVLDAVYEEIRQRDIWIPFEEVKEFYRGRIVRFSNKFKTELKRNGR